MGIEVKMTSSEEHGTVFKQSYAGNPQIEKPRETIDGAVQTDFTVPDSLKVHQ